MKINYYLIIIVSVAFAVWSGSFAKAASSPDVDRIVSELERSSSSLEFDSLLSELNLVLGDTGPVSQIGVMEEVVQITRKKPYAEKVLPDVYKLMGVTYANGRLDQAIVYFLESSNLYRQQQKYVDEALTYFQIAFLHHKAKNYPEAKDYYQKTLDLGGDSLESRTLINCYNGLALIERETKNYPEATKEFKKAFSIAVATKDTAWIGILYGNIGSIFKLQAAYDSALYYYQLNLSIIKNTTEYENLVETYIHLASIHLALKKLEPAKLFLDSAMRVFKQENIKVNDFFNPMPSFYENYALLYAEQGDFEKAFHYHQLLHEIYVELEAAVKSKSLIELNASHAFRQKQLEVELLEQINDSNSKVIEQQKAISVGFVLIIILTSALAIIMYRTSRQRKQSNQVLSQLNTQILEQQAEIKYHNVNLRKTNEELDHLNKTKDKLFSIISHDLRSPIGNLKSLLEMLSSGQIQQAEFQSFSKALSIRLETVNNALDNLLTWAISQINGINVNPESFQVQAMVQQAYEQLKDALTNKKINFENGVPEEIYAYADQDQIFIVLRNLISNAIKFTPEGGTIKVLTSIHQARVQISVIDTGVGMESDKAEKLFNSDHNTSTIGTNNESGTGIGLLICKELIKENGGELTVKSVKGEGSTFIFTLPLPPDTDFTTKKGEMKHIQNTGST